MNQNRTSNSFSLYPSTSRSSQTSGQTFKKLLDNSYFSVTSLNTTRNKNSKDIFSSFKTFIPITQISNPTNQTKLSRSYSISNFGRKKNISYYYTKKSNQNPQKCFSKSSRMMKLEKNYEKNYFSTSNSSSNLNKILNFDGINNVKANSLINRIKLFSNNLYDDINSNKKEYVNNKKPYNYNFFQKECSKKEMDNFIRKSPVNNRSLIKKKNTNAENFLSFNEFNTNFAYNIKKLNDNNGLTTRFNIGERSNMNKGWSKVDLALYNIEKKIKFKKMNLI